MKIIFHPLFIVILVVSFIFGFGMFILALLSAVVVHEFSHMLVAKRFGIKTNEMRLLPFGAEINIDCAFISTDQKILILLAGAFGNIITAVVFSSLLWLAPEFFLFFELIIVANAVPAIFNLMPIYPLDGGKILYLVFKDKNAKTADIFVKILIFVSNAAFASLFIASSLFFFNPALLLLCITMIININFELKKTSFISKISIVGKNRQGKIQEVAVNSGMTLFQVYKLVSGRYYTKFIFTDINNKVFYENDLEKMLLKNPIGTKLREVNF